MKTKFSALFISIFVLFAGGCAIDPAQVYYYPAPVLSNQAPAYPQAAGGTPSAPASVAPAVVYVPAPCPYGTYPAVYYGQVVCASQAVAYTYNPSFGWGVVAGVVGVAIIQSIYRGGHSHGYNRGGYRRW
ncbi:MAG: hypothetical protein AAB794_01380 [Patescibacteria group bacterium]